MEQLDTLQIASLNQKVCNLMIVDDEMMVTASLQAMLSMEMEHDIFCYNNPVEALAALDDVKPDLIISDFSMPEMDGICFLKAVKARLPEVTMILLTGYADKESAIEAINQVGLYRYIQKPWNNDELKISIHNGLERSYLVSNLKKTVHDLKVAQTTLSETNQHLEELVESKTQDLQATYHQLQAIVTNTTDGIVTLDENLQITSANPAVCQWIQAASLKDVLKVSETKGFSVNGYTIDQLLHTHIDSAQTNNIHHLFDQTTFQPFYEVFIGSLPLEMSIAPFQTVLEASKTHGNANFSKKKGYVLVLRDIRNRKEIERLREDFVSTLTHDLRTPLLAAIQTLGFFADGTLGTLTPRQDDLINMLISSNRELLGLVNVLLEVYKYESGQYKLLWDKLNLHQLIQLITNELQALSKSRGQTLTLSAPDIQHPEESLVITGDKQELKRVFTNLIGNAIHYTPQFQEGHIQVVIEKPDSTSVQVCVIDNGRGIPAQDIPVLFQRFSQGTSKQRSSGSGLGLFLSRQIVEAHQGQILVASEEGVGSRFTVSLPVHTTSEVPQAKTGC